MNFLTAFRLILDLKTRSNSLAPCAFRLKTSNFSISPKAKIDRRDP